MMNYFIRELKNMILTEALLKLKTTLSEILLPTFFVDLVCL